MTNYVSQDSNTQFLGGLLPEMGPATTEGTTTRPAAPWATLQPLIDDKTGQPFKKSDGNAEPVLPGLGSAWSIGTGPGGSATFTRWSRTIRPWASTSPAST